MKNSFATDGLIMAEQKKKRNEEWSEKIHLSKQENAEWSMSWMKKIEWKAWSEKWRNVSFEFESPKSFQRRMEILWSRSYKENPA